MLAALTILALAGLTLADLTHSTVKSGECVCVTGSGVNARNAAGTTGTHVQAVLNKGECYKLHGGILTKGSYKWFELDVSGQRLWVAGPYLNAGSSSQCSSSGGGACSDASAKADACHILSLHNSKKIELWSIHPSGVHDQAFALQNIKDACAGRAASRSAYSCNGCSAPGGHVCLNKNLLKYIRNLADLGYIHVNEISGACHSCNSRHYRGLAVDLHNDGRSSEYLQKCTSMGGWGQDEGNHIHCQFY